MLPVHWPDGRGPVNVTVRQDMRLTTILLAALTASAVRADEGAPSLAVPGIGSVSQTHWDVISATDAPRADLTGTTVKMTHKHIVLHYSAKMVRQESGGDRQLRLNITASSVSGASLLVAAEGTYRIGNDEVTLYAKLRLLRKDADTLEAAYVVLDKPLGDAPYPDESLYRDLQKLTLRRR